MSVAARTAVVVGNPRPASRTLSAALHLHRELVGREPDLVVDIATLGAGLFDWSDSAIGDLVGEVGRADLVVVACPTYKATYPGLLKLFLDKQYDDPAAYEQWLERARPVVHRLVAPAA